jgi:RNA polymerase sigma-70 factor (ECF subfamily)
MASHDEELVEAIKARDEDAAAKFDERFRGRIEALARRRGIPSNDCPDVAQDVLVDAVRQIRQGNYRGEASLGTWLHMIIGGKIGDYWRRHRAKEHVSLDIATSGERDQGAIVDNDLVLSVRQALGRLAPMDRFLLVLHEQQKYTLEEIGPMIGLRKSAVAERLAHARARFRIALRDGGKNLPSARQEE